MIAASGCSPPVIGENKHYEETPWRPAGNVSESVDIRADHDSPRDTFTYHIP
jgi:hypothetical protein